MNVFKNAETCLIASKILFISKLASDIPLIPLSPRFRP